VTEILAERASQSGCPLGRDDYLFVRPQGQSENATAAGHDAPSAAAKRKFAKMLTLHRVSQSNPVGQSAAEASSRRARRSAEYREELTRLGRYEELARQIIALRMRHNLSQGTLAERTGTTKSAISRLESGRHAPNVATLEKIASAFGGHLVISFEVPGQPAA
jgi:DNA-binding XRE family transcriptional regulator